MPCHFACLQNIFTSEYFAIVNNCRTDCWRLKSSPLIICHCSNCCPCGINGDNLLSFKIPLQRYYNTIDCTILYTLWVYCFSTLITSVEIGSLWFKPISCKCFTISKQITLKYLLWKNFSTWILNKTKPKHQFLLISSKIPKIAQFPYFHSSFYYSYTTQL